MSGNDSGSMPQVAGLIRQLIGARDSFGSWIDGALVPGAGAEIVLQNPATGEVFLSYLDAGEETVAMAAAAATKAQSRWWAMTASARGRTMWRCAAAINDAIEPLAQLECCTAGKPIRDCRIEVAKVAEMFEYYAGWCDKLGGEVIPVPSGHLTYTRREPYGVVTQITPWNAPIFTCGWQITPAICAGNGILFKPSELTPLSSTALVRIIEQAGIPSGLVNVLNGFGHTTGAAAIANEVIRKVIFVGSATVGRLIAEAAARRVVPCVLELGGKSANVVFRDADLNLAVAGAQAAIFAGAGQSCVAGSRLLIQRPIYEEVLTRLASASAKIRVGLPWRDDTVMGPINNQPQFDRVTEWVRSGLEAGATLVAGGKPMTVRGGENGFFYQPTVLAGVTNAMRIAQEEIFGPVVTAIPFEDEDEAVAIANDSRFGLAGAVWTGDVGRAHRMAARITAGTFWINSYKAISVMAPFGGFRDSGYGRSSGFDGLLEYSQSKSVWVNTLEGASTPFAYASE